MTHEEIAMSDHNLFGGSMTQIIDFRFELLFLALILVSLIGFIAAGMIRIQKPNYAMRLLKVIVISWILYISIVFLVAAVTPQRIIPMHQDLCLDEMCFAVDNVRTTSQLNLGGQRVFANGNFKIVTIRVSSHARGRSQSEKGLHAFLWSQNKLYGVSSNGQVAWNASHFENALLTTRLRPDESVLSDQVFDLPVQVTESGLVLRNGFGPGYFVIGECPLFHKPTILRLSR